MQHHTINYPILLCVIFAALTALLVLDDEPASSEQDNFNQTLLEVYRVAPEATLSCQYAATMTLTHRYSKIADYSTDDLECAREVVRAITME